MFDLGELVVTHNEGVLTNLEFQLGTHRIVC
jgi:hypothetical protein